MSHGKLESLFDAELKKLNEQQRKAVDTIEGPVMVIAGPGTGKTQILASRIGNILKSDTAQAGASNILCLTYTETGAVNMRQRLLKLIGPEAYRIGIHTFHAFCNQVIQDEKDYFGYSDLQPASDLEKVRLMRELIDAFPAGHPLKRYKGDVYFEAGRLQKLFDQMEKESWTPEFVLTHIEHHIQQVLTDPGNRIKKTGELKKKIQEEIKKLELSKSAVHEFNNYRKLLERKSRYTYNDMILWVLEAFRKNEDLVANYREQYRYILVDEYQDTNGAQNALLWQLAGEDESPNIFVVGDDDQAIYRFQGASSATMNEFRRRFDKFLREIVLKINYRSTSEILDISRSLIQHNTDRLQGVDKQLKAAEETYGKKPVIKKYLNEIEQNTGIVLEIEKLVKQGSRLDEIAIIYRKNREPEMLIRYLDHLQIPYNIRKSVDLLKENFIRMITTLLRYIDAESRIPNSAEHLLFEIMHFNFFSIHTLDIARLSCSIYEKKKEDESLTWRESLHRVEGDTDSLKAMKALSLDIEYWIKNIYNLTVQELVEKVLVRGGVLSYIMKQHQKFWLMEQMNSFFEFLKSESERNPDLTLHEFIDTIDLMNEAGIALPLVKVIRKENGIVLTTAHGSKGEEYGHVFLINASQNIWGKRPPERSYKLPQSLFSDQEDFDFINDERRLFYVAMTRAKRDLEISYTESDINGRELEKSRFIAELEESGMAETRNAEVPAEKILEYRLAIMEEQPVKNILFDKDYINHLLKDYQLSVTHLNNYLRCPVRFYFNNLLHVPMAKNESMEFGSAMHDVLQKIYFNLSTPEKSFLSPEKAVKAFHGYMHRHRESFTKQQLDRRLEYGATVIQKLFELYIPSSHQVVDVELRFRNIPFMEIPINGILDKIEKYDRHVRIVDYKTGNYYAEKFIRPQEITEDPAKMTFEEKHGGDYWRQAVFYALIVENYKSIPMEFEAAEFVFVEPDKKSGEIRRETVAVSDDDRKIVSDQIRQTWNNIHNHEFEEGCNEEDCDWCNFLKRNMKIDG
jgi:DNA helicase-2/ATP-dependent DNA helicase PcrA